MPPSSVFPQAFTCPLLAWLLHLLAAPLPRVTPPDFEAMHTFFSTRLTRAAMTAARPARRHLVRALRHHATRTRALSEQWRDKKPVDSIRTWFRTFFTALRVQGAQRRLSLRALLPNSTTSRIPEATRTQVAEPRSTSRRPRRTSATSTGWFAFATR